MPRDVQTSFDPLLNCSGLTMGLVPEVQEVLIEQAILDVCDQWSELDESQLDIEALSDAARKDARQLVRALLKHYDATDIEDVTDALGIEDADGEVFDDIAYYLAMQALGHGVSWSDKYEEGDLWAPRWDGAMWFITEELDAQLDELGYSDSDEDEEEYDEDEDEE